MGIGQLGFARHTQKHTEESKEKNRLAHLGRVPWNKGLKAKWATGKNNKFWKGKDVSYVGLHQWVARHRGKPDKCEHCGKDGLKGKNIQWANKSHEYKRDLTDWLRLCVPCHMKFDTKA